jgi:hypothetical protein
VSVEAFTWALNVPVGGNAKVVLLGLANHAHPDGSEAYPALDTLARYAHCDRSTARRNVRKLAADGWIIEDGTGPKGQTKYRLAMGGGDSPPVAPTPAGGGKFAPEGVAPVQPEPSKEPSKEPSGVARARATPSVRYRGKPVPRRVVDAALGALDEWAGCTAQTVRAFDGQGKPTDSLTRVIGAMLSFPEVVELYARMIDAATRRPWWEGSNPGVGVVFGPRVVERMIEQAKRGGEGGGAPVRNGDGPRRGGPTAADFAAIARGEA